MRPQKYYAFSQDRFLYSPSLFSMCLLGTIFADIITI